MHEQEPYSREEIEQHLNSAMDALTPDVWDRLDLDVPQEPRKAAQPASKVVKFGRRIRVFAAAAAACLCLMAGVGGYTIYANNRVDSTIGIDVNPSIEIDVNRRDRVVRAEALNSDGEEILDGMDLKNVQMNIAVNAVIGSMVRNGYFDDLDNAILVTVSNQDSEKASLVREDVVNEVESSLEEHNVSAVVYDQSATETGDVKELAEKYGISYGKAYFLDELVKENNLGEEDLSRLAGMTMQEIAQEISEKSLKVQGSGSENSASIDTEIVTTAEAETQTEPQETPAPAESTAEPGSSAAESAAGTKAPETAGETKAPETAAAATTAEETEGTKAGTPEVDDAEYDGETLTVTFDGKVSWKNASVSIEDEDGDSYPAKIVDTDGESCEIEVTGLPGSETCRFTIGGVAVKGGKYRSISGTFETPEIADGAEPNNYTDKRDADDTDDSDEEEETETAESGS